eukprot:scaffold6653_cov115-Isochrysis_galbana.AAC.2
MSSGAEIKGWGWGKGCLCSGWGPGAEKANRVLAGRRAARPVCARRTSLGAISPTHTHLAPLPCTLLNTNP